MDSEGQFEQMEAQISAEVTTDETVCEFLEVSQCKKSIKRTKN